MKSEIEEYQHLEASEKKKKRERPEKTSMRENRTKRSDSTRISRSRDQSTINVRKIMCLVDSTIEK